MRACSRSGSGSQPQWVGIAARDPAAAGGRTGAPLPGAGPDGNPFALALNRTGNQLERATRTVQSGLLFRLEHAVEGLTYSGRISGWVQCRPISPSEDPLAGRPLEAWFLVAALASLEKFGGGRTRGLGRCVVQVDSIRLGETTTSRPDVEWLRGVRDVADPILAVHYYDEADRAP